MRGPSILRAAALPDVTPIRFLQAGLRYSDPRITFGEATLPLLPGKYNTVCEFATTPGGGCAYTQYSSRVPIALRGEAAPGLMTK